MTTWVIDRVRLAFLDGEGDALEDLLGAVLGVDRDVQVLDVQRAHISPWVSQLGLTPLRVSAAST